MIIKKVHIEKFRGFQNVDFNMGSQITVIAGQNGTQKTTLLGMLSQPFSLTIHPKMSKEKPLCGGDFRSGFAEKFKLSPEYDKVGEHEWTLFFDNPALGFDSSTLGFTIESIPRSNEPDKLRFWKKGDRKKGSGYVKVPVIYLSLKRLYPIGEDPNIHESKAIILSDDEKKLYKKLHNDILILFDDVSDAECLESSYKTTVGVNTSYYDWRQTPRDKIM